MVEIDHQVVNLPLIVISLECEVIVEVVFGSLLWEVEIVLESLKCEVIDLCWLSAYPSCVRWILCWLCLASVRGCIQLREELCTPKSSMEVPCVGVLCGQVSRNPSVWRRGYRAVCSNLETNVGVCVWSIDSNSLSLFYIVPCIDSYYHIILICLVVIVCVPHLCLTTRAALIN